VSALNIVVYRLDRLEARTEWLVFPLKAVLDDVVTAVVTIAADLEATAYVSDHLGFTFRKEATMHWVLQDSLDEESWSNVASGVLTRASEAFPSVDTVLVTGDRVQSTVRITQPLGRAARLLLWVSAIQADQKGRDPSRPMPRVELAAASIEVRLGLRVLAGGHV